LINASLLQPILFGIRGFADAILNDTARPSPMGYCISLALVIQ